MQNASYHCKKIGHLARVCHSRKREGGQQRVRRTHQLTEEQDQPEDSATYSLFRTSTRDKPKPLLVTMVVNEKELQLEVDTGASVSDIYGGPGGRASLQWPSRQRNVTPVVFT